MADAPAPREWFSAADLAEMKLTGIPTEKKNVLLLAERIGWTAPGLEGSGWRKREARGGGIEFHYSLLPPAARATIAARLAKTSTETDAQEGKKQSNRLEMWAWWDRQPDSKKAKGAERVRVLQMVQKLREAGMDKMEAMQWAAREAKVSLATLYNWEELVAGVDTHDWWAFLTPRHVGRTKTVECDPGAWEFIKADYLRLEQPNFAACYRRLVRVAAEKGWAIPSEDTLKRRIDALPRGVRELTRKGEDALKVLYPYQKRDRSVFHALQAVNADGHKWDVFVKWPDGTIGRPLMVGFQDLYSNKFLSWRFDRSENREAVRLAFGDMLETFGIPELCYLDNGRSFASKWLTGGTPNRFRFKVRDDDPVGIMTSLQVEVHWTLPYSGQSKPIERGFKDFAQDVAKHPAFAGAYVGNSPMAKPENYGEKAVPLDLFIKVVGAEIAAHNAQTGRRTAIAAGRSFDQVFQSSYENSIVRKVSEEQRRLWLMAAEDVRVGTRDGSIQFMGNRYWHEDLQAHAGEKVVVRFDPELLHEPLHVYTLQGLTICQAECLEAAGFNSSEAAREHGRRRRSWMKGVKLKATAERAMSIDAVAAMLPEVPEPDLPETKVVRLFRGATALQEAVEVSTERQNETENLFVRRIAEQRAQRGQYLQLVEEAGDD